VKNDELATVLISKKPSLDIMEKKIICMNKQSNAINHNFYLKKKKKAIHDLKSKQIH
jgi:hypothetical protein